MKIAGLAAGNPSRLITKEEVLDLVVHHSRAVFEGDLERTVKLVDKLFHKSGIETRQWLGEDQHPMALMEGAFDRALAQAGIHSTRKTSTCWCMPASVAVSLSPRTALSSRRRWA